MDGWTKRARAGRMLRVGALALVGSLMAACGSGGGSAAASSAAPTSSPPTVSSPIASPTGAAGFSATCPPVSEVDAALAQHDAAAVSTPSAYGLTCTYQGSGPVATKVEFQQDTASTFAASENAVSGAVPVHGIGRAGFQTTGFIAVFDGSMTVKIVSPFSTTVQLEALARKVIG